MQNLRYIREAHGLNKSQLARLVGTTHNRIGYIEAGTHSPSLDIAVRIAAALDTTVDDLVREPEGAAMR